MYEPIEHPRDRSGRFLVSGMQVARQVARLERRLSAVERRLRSLRRAQASRARRVGRPLPPLAQPVRSGD